MTYATSQTRGATQTEQPNGIVRSYADDGWLLRSASYRDGKLEGTELLFAPAEAALFLLPLALKGDLERCGLAPDLRCAFADQQTALADDAVVMVVDPEREYLIESVGQCYTVQVVDGRLVIAPGRLSRRTHVQAGLIVSRAHYERGRLADDRIVYAPPSEPLFTLPLDTQPDCDSRNLKHLQPSFARQGYPLPDDARIALELADSEWRITQADQMFSVLRTGDRLTIYPGRIVRRDSFAAGHLVESVEYQAGRRDGMFTVYGPLGAALFRLDLALRAVLNEHQLGVLARTFQQHGHALATSAVITASVEDGEWFIAQPGQSYTIRRDGAGLVVFPGHVLSQSSYRQGVLDGATLLYDEQGMVAQILSYADGMLSGPLTIYDAGLKQTQVTFKRDKKHGPMIAYDAEGRPAMTSDYQDDHLHGEVCLYKDGRLQAQVRYCAGKQHGTTTTYHPSGKESLVAQYANGLLDGESVLYNEAGQVLKTSQYRDGKLEGPVIEYYPTGSVRVRSTYHDDKLEGIVYLYDPQGRLKEKTHYRNGEPVGKPEQRSWRQLLMQR